MKKKISKTKENLLSLNLVMYVIKYLRCVIVEAQMERVALSVFVLGNTSNKSKLVKLNNKHSQLANSLYQQKLKIELIA